MATKFPNLLTMYLIDTISEMLEIDSVETGNRIATFVPVLKGMLAESDAWNLVCQKPELEILKESFEIPAVISNLSVGEAWMLTFLLSHFNIELDEINNWKYECSVLDSTIPIIIRDYAHKLLFLKYILPNLKITRGPLEIDWTQPIPIHIPCPKCRTITNLISESWDYIQLHSPDSLVDYHKCPICKKIWAIRRFHIDESLWNLK